MCSRPRKGGNWHSAASKEKQATAHMRLVKTNLPWQPQNNADRVAHVSITDAMRRNAEALEGLGHRLNAAMPDMSKSLGFFAFTSLLLLTNLSFLFFLYLRSADHVTRKEDLMEHSSGGC